MWVQLYLIVGIVAAIVWAIARQRPPLRSIARNIVINQDGERCAVYRLPTESWRLASDAARDALGGRLAGVAEGLQRHFRLLRIHRGLDADIYRRQMASLCDPDSGHADMWQRRTELHYEHFSHRETFRPEVYIVVWLERPSAWSLTGKLEDLGALLTRGRAALGGLLRSSDVPGAEDGNWRRDEQSVFRRICQLGGERAATTEIEFLVRRNLTRGLGDPRCDEFWAPEAMRVEGDGQFEPEELDIARLFDCAIERLPDKRALKIDSELGVSYQTVFALGAIPELPLEEADILSGWLDHLAFPVDVVFDAQWRRNADAKRRLEWRAKKVAGMWQEEWEGNVLGPSAQTDQLPGLAQRLKGYLDDHSKPPLIEATTLFVIGARSSEELEDRADQFTENVDPIKVTRPVDQIAAHTTALPAGPCKILGYESPYKVEQLAYLAPTASPEGGSHGGVCIGNTRTKTALPVFFDIAEAPATDQTPTILLLGEQGGGKTVTMQYLELLAYESGSKIVDIDPKGTGALADGADHRLINVPTIDRDDFEIVEFSPEGMERGVLDPLRIAPADSKEDAAVSFYSALLGESGGMRETRLRQAVQHVLSEEGERYATGHRVIEWLSAASDTDSRELSEMLSVRADSTLARVGFAKSGDEVEERGTRQVVTLRLREIPIPSPDVPIAHWDAQDREGEAILKLAVTYGLRLTATSTAVHKLCAVDEFHAFDASGSSGYRFLQRINRLARSLNITPILASQRVDDVERLRGLIGALAVYTMRDPAQVSAAIELLGRDPHSQVLRDTLMRGLGNGACLFRGYDGRLCEMQWDLVDPELLQALGTTPGRSVESAVG